MHMLTSRTYWLYYGERLVASVRADMGAAESEVRRRALATHDSCPGLGLLDGEAPYELRGKILRARIKL